MNYDHIEYGDSTVSELLSVKSMIPCQKETGKERMRC